MKLLLRSFALTLGLISSFSLSAQLRAAPVLPKVLTSSYYTPPPPPDRGLPGDRGGGASRSPECTSQSDPLLTALVPQQTLSATLGVTEITQVWGLSSTDHPSFWFSVPYDPAKVSAIEFSLQNDQDQTIYRTPIPIPSAPGIVSVKLPSTVGGLEINHQYRWFFKVRTVCAPPNQPDSVDGWVQRTRLEPGLSDRLAHATPQERAALYAANGLWYDALTTLAELKLAQPGDRAIDQDWTELLKAVGLEDLATQPLIR